LQTKVFSFAQEEIVQEAEEMNQENILAHFPEITEQRSELSVLVR
jgi:hypothetical protein